MARNSGEKYKRLSSALRDNLLKRKEQQRSRQLDPQKDALSVDNLFENETQEDSSEESFTHNITLTAKEHAA